MRRLFTGLVCGTLGAITVYGMEIVDTTRRAPKLPPGQSYGIDPISILKIDRTEALIAGGVLFLAAFFLSR